MSVKLRLRREGTKKKAHFRIVAADTRSPRDGRFIEIIGDYHPRSEPSVVNIDEERALHWLRVGAQPSSQVENLLRITGVWEKFRPGDTVKPEAPTESKPSKKAREKAKAKAEEAAAAAEQPAAEEPAEAEGDAETTEEGGE